MDLNDIYDLNMKKKTGNIMLMTFAHSQPPNNSRGSFGTLKSEQFKRDLYHVPILLLLYCWIACVWMCSFSRWTLYYRMPLWISCVLVRSFNNGQALNCLEHTTKRWHTNEKYEKWPTVHVFRRWTMRTDCDTIWLNWKWYEFLLEFCHNGFEMEKTVIRDSHWFDQETCSQSLCP